MYTYGLRVVAREKKSYIVREVVTRENAKQQQKMDVQKPLILSVISHW